MMLSAVAVVPNLGALGGKEVADEIELASPATSLAGIPENQNSSATAALPTAAARIAPLTTGGVFQAPGTAAENVTLTVKRIFGRRHHTYEMGLIRVDDANGKIGALNPGDAGYARAALSSVNRQVLLATTDGNGDRGRVTIPGGSFYILYVIEDGTAANVVTGNPENLSNNRPFALFSSLLANPDDQVHLARRRGHRLGWETSVGDPRSRFNDLIFKLKVGRPAPPPDTTPPTASLSITGTIPTTTTQFDVRFTEPMNASFLQKAGYSLTRTSGTGSPTVVTIVSVQRLDNSTVRIQLQGALTAGTHRFDIAATLSDRAGNALSDPRSFNFTVA